MFVIYTILALCFIHDFYTNMIQRIYNKECDGHNIVNQFFRIMIHYSITIIVITVLSQEQSDQVKPPPKYEVIQEPVYKKIE